jgi:quercetin dioxygenase-like cupin family protein
MNKKLLLGLWFFLVNSMVFSQTSDYYRQYDIEPEVEFENIHVVKLSEDSLMSTFIIWVKKEVKAHKHLYHTENVFVLAGEGLFRIADEEFTIKQGDMVFIPKNTVHAVITTSKQALKVISVQSPIFLGDDRILVE